MKLTSSFIREVDWKDGIMKVSFRNGTTFTYYKVPEGVFKEFVTAGSPGRYYHSNIKGKYTEQ